MAVIGFLGVGLGFVCGLAHGFALGAGLTIFWAVLTGFLGMIIGLGLGSFLYSPRWASWGFVIVTFLLSSAFSAVLIWGNGKWVQQADRNQWLELGGFVVIFGLNGAAIGGISKCALEQSKQERLRAAPTEPIDKGWCLSYSKLSYRRKFLRCCWSGPLSIALFVVIQVTLQPFSPTVAWILLALSTVQLIVQTPYTYRRWQQEKMAAPAGSS